MSDTEALTELERAHIKNALLTAGEQTTPFGDAVAKLLRIHDAQAKRIADLLLAPGDTSGQPDERIKATCGYCGREALCSTTPGTGGGGVECDPPCSEALQAARRENVSLRARIADLEKELRGSAKDLRLVTENNAGHTARMARALAELENVDWAKIGDPYVSGCVKRAQGYLR